MSVSQDGRLTRNSPQEVLRVLRKFAVSNNRSFDPFHVVTKHCPHFLASLAIKVKMAYLFPARVPLGSECSLCISPCNSQTPRRSIDSPAYHHNYVLAIPSSPLIFSLSCVSICQNPNPCETQSLTPYLHRAADSGWRKTMVFSLSTPSSTLHSSKLRLIHH